MRTAILISMSAMALAGCGGATNTSTSTTTTTTTITTTTDGAPSAANAASGASATAGATLPAPRAGLWEITTTTIPAGDGRGPRGPMRSCSDGQTPARVGGGGAMRDPACQPQVSQADGATVLTTDCTTEGGVHIRSTTRITGDSQAAYQMRTERDVEGAPLPQMNGHRVIEVSARHLGECPANMPPGSIEIGGRVITREQMQQMRGRGGGMGGMGGG